jgi:NADH dehydrogenase
MSRVLITGASGFLAGAFARELSRRGSVAVGAARRPRPLPHFETVVRGELGQSLDLDLARVDAVIHCACDLDDLDVNTPGTVTWAEQAQAAGVRRQLFIGSLSGIPGALSAYGRHKHETAAWFVERGQPVLSLGLVLGLGGIFGRMIALMARSPVLPLIGGGRHRTSVVDQPTVVGAVCDLVGGDAAARVYTVHEPERYTMRELLVEARHALGLSTWFVAVPMPIARAGVGVLGVLGLSIGIRRENLDGLEQNDRVEVPTDVARFRTGRLTLRELITRAELR